MPFEGFSLEALRDMILRIAGVMNVTAACVDGVNIARWLSMRSPGPTSHSPAGGSWVTGHRLQRIGEPSVRVRQGFVARPVDSSGAMMARWRNRADSQRSVAFAAMALGNLQVHGARYEEILIESGSMLRDMMVLYGEVDHMLGLPASMHTTQQRWARRRADGVDYGPEAPDTTAALWPAEWGARTRAIRRAVSDYFKPRTENGLAPYAEVVLRVAMGRLKEWPCMRLLRAMAAPGLVDGWPSTLVPPEIDVWTIADNESVRAPYATVEQHDAPTYSAMAGTRSAGSLMRDAIPEALHDPGPEGDALLGIIALGSDGTQMPKKEEWT